MYFFLFPRMPVPTPIACPPELGSVHCRSQDLRRVAHRERQLTRLEADTILVGHELGCVGILAAPQARAGSSLGRARLATGTGVLFGIRRGIEGTEVAKPEEVPDLMTELAGTDAPPSLLAVRGEPHRGMLHGGRGAGESRDLTRRLPRDPGPQIEIEAREWLSPVG